MESSWRNGPAKLWYDMVNLPEDCQYYDYGFKIKNTQHQHEVKFNDPDDAFHMVTQFEWEKDVIWDNKEDNIKDKIIKERKRKREQAGWIPDDAKRFAPNFVRKFKCDIKDGIADRNKNNHIKSKDTTSENNSQDVKVKKEFKHIKWISTLPVINGDLISSCWEDEVIWDHEAMNKLPQPRIVPLDPNDDNVVINFDDDSSGFDLTIDPMKNSLNISDDEYYSPINKSDNELSNKIHIRHSTAALQLDHLLFPTSLDDLKNLHKPLLKPYSYGPLANHSKFHSIEILQPEKYVKNQDLLVKAFDDLSAKRGKLVLMEYAEEHPPLVMQNGMASRIINYYKRNFSLKEESESQISSFKYGEDKLCHFLPFFGNLKPGQSQQSLENNLFRAPIYEHSFRDFLVIRTKEKYFLRCDIDTIFTVGQQLPFVEVPAPKSKKMHDFLKNFIRFHVFNEFHYRKSIRLEEILRTFTQYSEESIRKKISQFVEFQRRTYQGKQTVNCVLKPEFRLPTEEEIQNLVTPEDCCAYYSAVQAEKRLNDIGLTEELSLYNENDQDNKESVNYEVKAAPWNTTKAFLSSISGKSLLQLDEFDIKNSDGLLTYIPISNKLSKIEEEIAQKPLPLLNGSIRKMNLKKLRDWLIAYGISREKIKTLNRFDCIEAVEKLSKEMKMNGKTSKLSKREHLVNQYKIKTQTIFQFQRQKFSSKNESSTDEEGSDTDLDDMGKDLESMLTENKTKYDLDFEKEEMERKQLLAQILNNKVNNQSKKASPKESTKIKNKCPNQVLKISRTFQNENGQTFVRDELVKKPEVIQAYIKIKKTKDDEFINKMCNSKLSLKDFLKRERSKTKNLDHAKSNYLKHNHLKENIQTISYDHQDLDFNFNNENQENCDFKQEVVVEDTVVKFSKQVVQNAFEIRRLEEEQRKSRRSFDIEYTQLKATRCRVDPMVKLVDFFDNLILKIRKLPDPQFDVEPFLEPVKPKDVPDYYRIIKNPMDLKTLRKNVKNKKYTCREQFLDDVNLMYENSKEYNGKDHEVTKHAKFIMEYCIKEFSKNEDFLLQHEIKANPSLSQSNQIHH